MNNLTVTEYKDIRVLTTQQIAEAYETTDKVISNNFNNNKDRYKEGKHYICLIGEELRAFKGKSLNLGIAPNANKFYLWTEKGAFLHAKSLNTDKAWEVYDHLVDTYFTVRNEKQKAFDRNQLSQETQALFGIIESVARQELEQKRQAEQIQKVEQRVESIRDVVAIDTTSWREETGKILRKIGNECGDSVSYQEVRAESYKLLEKRMGVNLKQRLTNKRRRMADEGICKSKRDSLNNLDIIAEDKKLIEGYTAIVKEMAIKYGVA